MKKIATPLAFKDLGNDIFSKIIWKIKEVFFIRFSHNTKYELHKDLNIFENEKMSPEL